MVLKLYIVLFNLGLVQGTAHNRGLFASPQEYEDRRYCLRSTRASHKSIYVIFVNMEFIFVYSIIVFISCLAGKAGGCELPAA